MHYTEFNEEEGRKMFQSDVDAERKRADEAEARLNEALAELARLKAAQ